MVDVNKLHWDAHDQSKRTVLIKGTVYDLRTSYMVGAKHRLMGKSFQDNPYHYKMVEHGFWRNGYVNQDRYMAENGLAKDPEILPNFEHEEW